MHIIFEKLEYRVSLISLEYIFRVCSAKRLWSSRRPENPKRDIRSTLLSKHHKILFSKSDAGKSILFNTGTIS